MQRSPGESRCDEAVGRLAIVCVRSPTTQKPPILKAYLDRFRREVQRYFPVMAGSPPDAFAPHAARYPAFELEAEP